MYERDLIIIAAILMLIVVLPAILLALIFAWKFRGTNKKAHYISGWQSKKVEISVWIAPTLIVIALATLLIIYTFKLDPYRPIPSPNKALTIQVVSLDWKWLFIYPQQNRATINEIVIPVNTPIHFLLTSGTVMNSFFIPQLGSQIMTMAGMQTQLYLIAPHAGTYEGISANFSGPGFAWMHFKVIATSQQQFAKWLQKIKIAAPKLDFSRFKKVAEPSTNNPVSYFSAVQPQLFTKIMREYMHQPRTHHV